MCKIMNFEDNKGKNKYNMIGCWIKGQQHLKTPQQLRPKPVWSKS